MELSTAQVTRRAIASEPNWKKIVVESKLPQNLQPLKEISKNLWWVWNEEAQELFYEIDPQIWEATNNNPIVLLEEVTLERLEELENDQEFLTAMNKVKASLDQYMEDRNDLSGPEIAYFSMEYGLHSSLKIYSGGLGVLAGDYLKEASDSKSNMVAVGLLYRFGYFKQVINRNGEQIAQYDAEAFSKIAAQPVMLENDQWLTVSVEMPGRTVFARVWKVNVGSVALYLLDTDLEENQEYDRNITHHLYGGDNENRLKQEMVLGLGGIKALEALGHQCDIYHCNEGHAAFITLERMKNMLATNMSYPVASEIIRASTLFTTHTPVPAGHDAFHVDLFRHYMGIIQNQIGINWEEFMHWGTASEYEDHFNMSYLASHFSQEINGVSRLHGDVSKELLKPLFPGYLTEELTNIGYVTNGVHYPTWVAKEWRDIHNDHLDRTKPDSILEYSEEKEAKRWSNIYKLPDELIWNTKVGLKNKLFTFLQDRIQKTSRKQNENPKVISDILSRLDPSALTIGFARRFATYKRSHLLFRDLDRLSKIVNNPNRPVQFLFAGKAHPADGAGQGLIKYIMEISKRPEFQGKIVFIQDYDMNVAKKMLQGVDIWMNTPTRPLEASGTSGEKGVMNGTLHFSVLDGWWCEGYRPEAGWALDEKRTFENQELQDEMDAETIYSLLEDEIIGSYYYRSSTTNVPRRWVDFIKNSFSEVAPHFTMTRQLKDYYDRYYLPLAERKSELVKDNCAKASKIATWKESIYGKWDQIEVVNIQLADGITNTYNMGKEYPSRVELDLKGLSSDDIGVEIVIASSEDDPKLIEVQEFESCGENNGFAAYELNLTLKVPGTYKYGLRMFPKHPLLPHRLDLGYVRWI